MSAPPKIDWRCSGCGKLAPGRAAQCACTTGVVYTKEPRREAWKIGRSPEEEYDREAARRAITDFERRGGTTLNALKHELGV